MKTIKYFFCAISLAITLSFISAAIITSKEFPVSERILFLMTLFGGLVLLGGFFVLIAERKKLVQNSLKVWLYVMFVPVVSWLDILLQPEPDGSNRLKHFSKDVYKFAMYLWGYKSRAIFFVFTIGVFVLTFNNSSEYDYTTRFTVLLIYVLLDISVGFYFFKIAGRKQCFIFNSKILTGLYIFFVPVASWKEIFLKPEADGTRVKAILNDTTSIVKFLAIIAKYILGSIALSVVVFLLVIHIYTFFTSSEASIKDLLLGEFTVLWVLALTGRLFVYIAKRKNLFPNEKSLWLYVMFVPVVSWIDILLRRSR